MDIDEILSYRKCANQWVDNAIYKNYLGKLYYDKAISACMEFCTTRFVLLIPDFTWTRRTVVKKKGL